jgi:FtsP/CotA-like multicopper oxidase with cupredoxin domain
MAVSPFSDGTPGASQWPIPPNHYFDYELEMEVGHAGSKSPEQPVSTNYFLAARDVVVALTAGFFRKANESFVF